MIASNDLDFSSYDEMNAYNPSSNSNWTAGVSVQYTFSLSDYCNDLSYCNFLTQNYPSVTEYQLTGTMDYSGLDLSLNLSLVDLRRA